MFNLFSLHLISSHRSFSWKLLTVSHCHRSLCHPISLSPHHLNSSQLIRCLLSFFFTSSHIIPSHVFSPSQLFSADYNYPHRFSCHLSFSHLFSSHLGLSQLKPSHLFSRPKPAPKTDLDAKASNPYAFHREDFTQKTFARSKLVHREAWTHRSFYTELGKLSASQRSYHTQQAFTQRSLYSRSFCTQQTFTHRKLLQTASFHTKNILHTEPFTHSKRLHTANLHTQ